MSEHFVYKITGKKLPNNIGSKAQNLSLLKKRGFCIPDAFVCTWNAYLIYLQEGSSVLEKLRAELENTLNPNMVYAVRSSANYEDSLDKSFAGQFSTFLGVENIDSVLEAIKKIWENSRSETVDTYNHKVLSESSDLKMAIIIQDMISAEFSGVSFSKHPVTGMDEIVVEAIQGDGTALVQEGVTPFRWINKWGNWIEVPEEREIPIEVIQDVVNTTDNISKIFRRNVDLEWVFDGRKLYWLQLRDITSIDEIQIYSNRISKGMMPGMIKPLVFSSIAPVMSSQWVRLITEMIGVHDIDADKLVRTYYYRAYFDMGTFGKVFASLGLPSEFLEMMLGLLPPDVEKPVFKIRPKAFYLLPRLIPFIWGKWTLGNKVKKVLPKLETMIHAFPLDSLDVFSEVELESKLKDIYNVNRELTYYSIVIQLLMLVYNFILKRLLQSQSVNFLNYDLTSGINGLEKYNPGIYLEKLNNHYRVLSQDLQVKIKDCTFTEFQQLTGIDDYKQEVNKFIDQFGHLSDNNSDFSSITWREQPEMVLRLITDYHELDGDFSAKVGLADLHSTHFSKYIIKMFHNRARQFMLYREYSSSLLTYSYGLFRAYYLEFGERLTRRGILNSPDDIFFLYDQEIYEMVDGKLDEAISIDKIANRKQEFELSKDTVLPEIIYGDSIPTIVKSETNKLTGIGTSGGYYTGRIKVVRGIDDITKLEEGNVLIIPFSDIGWTPLFARAGAVISESGGMLSHSSIIAREYNIPAVVSVPGAMQLADDCMVSIDGYKGEVLIHKST